MIVVLSSCKIQEGSYTEHMFTNKQLTDFLLKARTQTYAAGTGKVESLIPGTEQFEYQESEFSYRDIYNVGKGKFVGLETIYFDEKPVWSMAYYGNFGKLSEEETDLTLRKALMDKWDEVRIWNTVEYSVGEYEYLNEGMGTIEELQGTEKISKNGEEVYSFIYAGGTV